MKRLTTSSDHPFFSAEISRANFDAQICQLLYATGTLHDNEELEKMEYKFEPATGMYIVRAKRTEVKGVKS